MDISVGSARVRATPKYGGEIQVAFSMLKKYPQCLEFEAGLDEGEVEEEIAARDRAGEGEELEEFTPAEMQQSGHFLVARILQHKYQNGWRFLVKWAEPFTIADCTWEPLESFVIGKNRLNDVFEEYCLQHQLREALGIAQRRAARKE